MPLLDRAAILAAADRKFEDVEVPEWGGTVRVSLMSGAARERWERDYKASADAAKVRAAFVQACAVDDQFRPLFTLEDVEALAQKSWLALDRVFRVAMTLNGTTAGATEDAQKNS